MSTIILDHKAIAQKTKRISLQIAEVFYKEEKIILAGVNGKGYTFTQLLAQELKKHMQGEVIICEIKIDKKQPMSMIDTDIDDNLFDGASLVIVDDVLNSGSTLMYSVKYFLDFAIKQMKTAVLVNRNHKRYPVKADFKGLSLSTTLEEHIMVDFGTNPPVSLH